MKEIYNIILKKEYFLIFTVFFLFFFCEAPFSVGSSIYLKNQNFEELWAYILTASNISILIMPLIISRFSQKFGNINVLTFSLVIVIAIFSLVLFKFNYVYLAFFSFPFFIRVFNNTLTPYIAKIENDHEKSLVFSIRDIFLSLGIACGFLFSSYLAIDSFNFKSNVFIVTTILIIIFIVIKVFKTNDTKIVANKKLKLFQLPFKEVNNKKSLAAFIIISSGLSWVLITVSFLPIYLTSLGFESKFIFDYYSLAYFIVPFLGLIAAMKLKNINKKYIYIFD
ncbi:MAG: MFS transporter, partial [Pseudomonadota bacterium]